MQRRFYGRILVPLDGTDLAEQILPYVEPLSRRFGSTVILLEVMSPPEVELTHTLSKLGSAVEATRREATDYSGAVAQRLRGRGVTVECLVEQGQAAFVIADTARQLQADLIAMATHGRGGLRRLFYDELRRAAPCPVLYVRANEPA
ncbi:MAG: universal stress protein [Chloroflexi bacterium]|nr:universal stress protein [Chloroflexota bacterium]